MDGWMMGNRRRIWMRLTKAQADGVFSWVTDWAISLLWALMLSPSLSLSLSVQPLSRPLFKITLRSVWWQAGMKWLALSFPPTALLDNHYTYWLPPLADSTLLKPVLQYIMLLWLGVTALNGLDLKSATVDFSDFVCCSGGGWETVWTAVTLLYFWEQVFKAVLF